MDGSQLLDYLTGRVAHGFGFEPEFEGAPHGQRQEADQDVRLHPILLLVKDRAQAQVAFARAKGIFDFCKLDVPAPEFAGVFLGAELVRKR